MFSPSKNRSRIVNSLFVRFTLRNGTQRPVHYFPPPNPYGLLLGNFAVPGSHGNPPPMCNVGVEALGGLRLGVVEEVAGFFHLTVLAPTDHPDDRWCGRCQRVGRGEAPWVRGASLSTLRAKCIETRRTGRSAPRSSILWQVG